MKIFEITLFWITLAPSYYGLMYILGFLYGLWAIKKTGRYNENQRELLFFYIFAGVVFWGRLWYVLFYNFSDFLLSPLDILKVWQGGMSFHGWFIWVCIALIFYARKQNMNLWKLADDIASIIPVGLFFGRIGNYINKELLGFPYDGFLAVQTPQGSFFPSPLIEAFLEGVVIYVVLQYILKRQKFDGQLASLFFILYWLFRTFVELFIRTPDIQIWYYFWIFTQGSLLSIPMIWIGMILYSSLWRKKDF